MLVLLWDSYSAWINGGVGSFPIIAYFQFIWHKNRFAPNIPPMDCAVSSLLLYWLAFLFTVSQNIWRSDFGFPTLLFVLGGQFTIVTRTSSLVSIFTHIRWWHHIISLSICKHNILASPIECRYPAVVLLIFLFSFVVNAIIWSLILNFQNILRVASSNRLKQRIYIIKDEMENSNL